MTEDLATLQTDIERQEESGPDAGLRYLDEEGDEDDDEDEDYQLQSPTATLNRDRTQSPSRRRKSSRSMSSTGARGAYFIACLTSTDSTSAHNAPVTTVVVEFLGPCVTRSQRANMLL